MSGFRRNQYTSVVSSMFVFTACIAFGLFETPIVFAQTYIEVAQESQAGLGDYDCNILGSIRPWPTTDSAAAFYRYGLGFCETNPNSVSFAGDWTYGPLASKSHLLFVDTTDGLTLVMVHDRRCSNGGGKAKTQIEVIGNTGSISRTVEDDPGSGGEAPYGGTAGSTVFTADHDWNGNNTDGQALSGFSGPWSAIVQFVSTPTNLIGWEADSFDGAWIPLELTANRRVRFRAISPPVANSLVAMYTFDDDTYFDVSGNNRLAYKAPSAATAPVFNAAGFEGKSITTSSTSWIRVDTDISAAQYPQITIGGWAKPLSVVATRYFLGHGAGGSNRGLAIGTISGNLGWLSNVGAGGGTNGSGSLGVITASVNEWQFVAATYDSVSGVVQIYVNGQLLQSTGNPPAGNSRFSIGRNPSNVNYFDGEVDNIFLLSEVLSLARLSEIRSGGYHRIPTCPVFVRQPQCQATCAGDALVFSVDVAGSELGAPLTLQWRRNGIPLANSGHFSDVTTSMLTVTGATIGEIGFFDCVATNACGSVTSRTATLRIIPTGSGDGNGDGRVNGLDVQGMTSLLTGSGAPPLYPCAYDMNLSGAVDNADIPLLITVMLAS